ncbi:MULTISPECIES: phenol hydroxylase subunit P4 [Hydrocarboniphaga]|uniref:Phenol hydrolase gammma subunit n=1 Tax=Hydrocarboniphaga effusa AP103 TaxID=1172194 RepID=I8TB39_9GAMM|nr:MULTISPECIES: phenol hydroxylase subunit P4 [Hydrocarboniphaga]EIT70980.1 phenol hydrolase gammma subunit [Hydrocarboniphaga effusa AP103]MDZ4079047.1 phenol hydroxylase subunit P4 [Hydrocarboniphaga sp.]
MPVKAIKPGYHGEYKDGVENFHGQQLLNISWDKHIMFGFPVCIPVPPQLPFGALIEKVLPGIYGAHPDFAKIDWSTVQWSTAKGAFVPEPERSLAEHGLRHKEQIRFRTPGLDGHNGAG